MSNNYLDSSIIRFRIPVNEGLRLHTWKYEQYTREPKSDRNISYNVRLKKIQHSLWVWLESSLLTLVTDQPQNTL